MAPSKAWNGVTFGMTGSEEIKQNLDTLAAQYPHDMGQVMHEEYSIEFEEMLRRVPVNEGDLKESGELEQPQADDDGIVMAVHFGSPEVPYAVAQHQKHYEHPDGGQREYMLSVLEESKRFMGGRIARRGQQRLASRLR